MNLNQSNNDRIKKLSESQKKELKKELIFWRVTIFLLLNAVCITTIGIAFGLGAWALIMIFFFDKHLVNWVLNRIDSSDNK